MSLLNSLSRAVLSVTVLVSALGLAPVSLSIAAPHVVEKALTVAPMRAVRPTPASPVTTLAVPAGFVDTPVITVSVPTALAFTPDKRMLVTTQGGLLNVYSGTTYSLLGTAVNFATSWPTTRICSNFERGLLGIAVDPDFATNNYVYLYYTTPITGTACPFTSPNVVNRISRFTMAGNSVLTATELILIDNLPSWGGNHNAGDLHFGNDGYLYISVGDGGTDYDGSGGSGGSNNASRDEFILLGKILRITSDGNIPPDNPFQGAGTARCNVTGRTTPGNRCRETYAWGLRNPFRFTFDPNTPLTQTRFFINDVGQNVWEEIDLGQSGVDYGWNCREGAHTNSTTGPCSPTPPSMVDPIYEFNHSTGCGSITGGAFVPNTIGWPSAYTDAYLFADYNCGGIFRMNWNGSAYVTSTFASGLGGSSAVHMRFGPYLNTQALYYTTFSGTDTIHRVVYALAQPTAVLTASHTTGPTPLEVVFDGSGSFDPQGRTPFTYTFDFGDSVTTITSAMVVTHTYITSGTFTATLVVSTNTNIASNPVSVTIQPNTFLAPIAAFSAAPSLGPAPLLVTFDASASSDPDGYIPLTYTWDFGDGAVQTTALVTTTHLYTSDGVYTPTLIVTNTLDLGSAPVTHTVIVAAVPTAVFTATPDSGIAPVLVNFDASASSDPGGFTPLTFNWDFDDGSTLTTQSVTVTHLYTAVGTFTPSLMVSNSLDLASAPATTLITTTNTAPVPTILTPTAGTLFAVGELITLTGIATDTQDGTLPGSSLFWSALLWHIYTGGTPHNHPLFTDIPGNSTAFNFPAPEDLAATGQSYVEISLRAVDSVGAETIITQTLEPRRVPITITSNPPGLTLTVNEIITTTPFTVTSWQNFGLNLSAPQVQLPYVFTAWSDGGAASHTALTPAGPTTYTATYTVPVPPTAYFTASPVGGGVPLTVTFDASGSSDPQGLTPLTYTWDFGDSNVTATLAAVVTHTYQALGVYTASLIVSNTLDMASVPFTRVITPGNEAPVPTITAPAPSAEFAVGEVITLTGVATDTEDGTLPNSNVQWSAWLWTVDNSGAQATPLLTDVVGYSTTLTFPAPANLGATALSYIEVQFTAADSLGAETTVTQTLQPKRVNVTLDSVPVGLTLQVNEVISTTPFVVTAWANFQLDLQAPNQTLNTVPYFFSAWSDSGGANHSVLTPASPITYTATFAAGYALYLPLIAR